MKTVKASAEIIQATEHPEEVIERAARVCYQSEPRGGASGFVRRLISRGHEAPLEHAFATVRFIVDRGVSHEIVRHRLASYCQESTRYCEYDDECVFVEPNWPADGALAAQIWYDTMQAAENAYKQLLASGATPQWARTVLPNSLKTELIMTANLREWRHFFALRTDKAAHPQMREVTVPLHGQFQKYSPAVFGV